MSKKTKEDDKKLPKEDEGGLQVYIPDYEERKAISMVLDDYVKGRNLIQKGYNYFNGRSLIDCIDDWTKRWNGYIPAQNPLLDTTQSQIFLNYTRNAIISYLVKTAMTVAKPKFVAINKKNKIESKQFAQFLKDVNNYSLNNENGDAKFFAAALETATKGTCITYEGYLKQETEVDVPVKYDSTTGEMKTKKEKRVMFDDCYQEIHPVEDFLIANPFQPDIQKQLFILPRKITTFNEANDEFGHYPQFKYVKAGQYTLTAESTTFYRNSLISELAKDQVEVLRWYSRIKNRHIVMINGVIIYDGCIPFKDGKYPYAKAIHEPFANDFFWGAGAPNKIMGEQDLKNMLTNMMVDKTQGSLLPYGLSSDLDDLVEDEFLQPNKIRKVGDINKWKFESLPGVTSGEVQMLGIVDKNLGENSGDASGAGSSSSPRGGKLAARQVLMKQQELMQKLGFSTNYLEDYERDRTELRVNHILQFYSIPKFEAITGVAGKDAQKLVYRDVTIENTKLQDGRIGNKVIRLTDKLGSNDKTQMADDLSVIEEMGDMSGVPTEAMAIDVNTFYDYNTKVQIVKNSTYEKNEVLEQSKRMEFSQWRLSVAQAAPVNAPELIKWVEEAFDDIESERFEGQAGPQQAINAQAGGNGQGAEGAQGAGGTQQNQRPMSELNRTDNASSLSKATQ